MGSKFFGNKHDTKTNKNNKKTNPKSNSKGKGSNMGVRKVGRGN